MGILDAAVTCLAEVGCTGATTAAILERAGVSRGQLLRQFPSEDELVVAAVSHLARPEPTELIAKASLCSRHDGSGSSASGLECDVPAVQQSSDAEVNL